MQDTRIHSLDTILFCLCIDSDVMTWTHIKKNLTKNKDKYIYLNIFLDPNQIKTKNWQYF